MAAQTLVAGERALRGNNDREGQEVRGNEDKRQGRETEDRRGWPDRVPPVAQALPDAGRSACRRLVWLSYRQSNRILRRFQPGAQFGRALRKEQPRRYPVERCRRGHGGRCHAFGSLDDDKQTTQFYADARRVRNDDIVDRFSCLEII